MGLGRLLPGLDPRLTWNGRKPTLAPHVEYARDLGGQGLVLMPSVFSWPDVVTGFEAPWQPTLVYPARGLGGLWTEPGTRTPEALVRLPGRNRVAVLAESATTGALAHRLGLAPSSVSSHLTILRDAGLLTSRRYGHQVLYERTPLGVAPATGG